MNEIVEILKNVFLNNKNEATRAPWWAILDPAQNMNCDVYHLASQITGPFFCREDAERWLKNTRYNFGKRAVVFCFSGCYSHEYNKLCDEIEDGIMMKKK